MKIVLATTTFNMSIFPYMNEFITCLTERNYQNKTVGLIENGTWAATAAKIMKERLSTCKNITFLEPVVKLVSAVSEENKLQLKELAKELMK